MGETSTSGTFEATLDVDPYATLTIYANGQEVRSKIKLTASVRIVLP